MAIDWKQIGKRSKGKGQRKQAIARGILDDLFGPTPFRSAAHHGHEERWQHMLAVEVKAGAQIEPIRLRYNKAAIQYADVRRDGRPFALMAMPDGSTKALFVMTNDNLERLLLEVIERTLAADEE